MILRPRPARRRTASRGRSRRLRWWLLPVTLVVAGAVQQFAIGVAASDRRWSGLSSAFIGLAFLLTLGLALATVAPKRRERSGEEAGVTGLDPSQRTQAHRNGRDNLLQAMRTLLIEARRQPLEEYTRIFLGRAFSLSVRFEFDPTLVEMEDAVSRRPAGPVPRGATLPALFEQSDRLVLLVGPGGAGKSDGLLRIVDDLLTRASSASDSSHARLPVRLDLTHWFLEQLPLDDWAVERMGRRYGVPPEVGQDWLATGSLVLLLDNLDRLVLPDRHRALDAIAAFRATCPGNGILLCCREQEFRSLEQRAPLHNALRILPLEREYVLAYLQAGGRALAALLGLAQRDSRLADTLATPLMLTTAAVAYLDEPSGEIPVPIDPDRPEAILARFVAKVLHREGPARRYPIACTMRWLSWMARGMERTRQLDYPWLLSVTWLPDSITGRLLVWSLGAASIAMGVTLGYTAGWILGGPIFGVVVAPVTLVLSSLAAFGTRTLLDQLSREEPPAPPPRPLGDRLRVRIRSGWWLSSVLAVLGSLGWVAWSEVTALSRGDPTLSWSRWGREALLGAAGGAVLGILAAALSALRRERPDESAGQEQYASWLDAGLAFAPIGAWVVGVWTMTLLLPALLFASAFPLLAARLARPGVIERIHTQPRFGHLDELAIRLFLELDAGIKAAPMGSWYPTARWVLAMAAVGLITGVLVFLVGIAIAAAQPVLVRRLLQRRRLEAPSQAAFLYYAVELGLLRRISGSYQFHHPLFQSYFAGLAPALSENVGVDCGPGRARTDALGG